MYIVYSASFQLHTYQQLPPMLDALYSLLLYLGWEQVEHDPSVLVCQSKQVTNKGISFLFVSIVTISAEWNPIPSSNTIPFTCSGRAAAN